MRTLRCEGARCETVQAPRRSSKSARPVSTATLAFVMIAVLWFAPPGSRSEEIYRQDPLALLSGTLRTYQRAGCEGELVTLRCPQGTTISVQVAQYGRPPPSSSSSTSSSVASTHYRPPPICRGVVSPNMTCHWPMQLQYSLLQMVVEACQNKRQCKFLATPKSLISYGDPCPGAAKFVEVAYKCRPFEFRSKVACEEETTEIRCGPRTRLAIYSATFGRNQMESFPCPQRPGVREESCLTSYTTETVMQMCHGKRQCSLTASKANFGQPCQDDTRMYLKVVYTCVSGKVLKEHFDDRISEDEYEISGVNADGNGVNGDGNWMYDEYDDTDKFLQESAALSPPNPKPVMREDMQEKDEAGTDTHFNTAEEDEIAMKHRRAQEESLTNIYKHHGEISYTDEVGFTSKPQGQPLEPLYPQKTEGSQEKLYWYIGAGVSAGLLLLIIGAVLRVILARHKKSATPDSLEGPYSSGTHTRPVPDNLFPDTESEIEAEIDLALASSTLNSQYSRHNMKYPRNPHLDTKGGKEADDDTNPRSLSRSWNNQYYYT